MKPEKEWEYGLNAVCWHCNKPFTKTNYCETCGYYICPSCAKCGCHLSTDQKRVVDYTFETLAPILTKAAKNRMGLHSHEH